ARAAVPPWTLTEPADRARELGGLSLLQPWRRILGVGMLPRRNSKASAKIPPTVRRRILLSGKLLESYVVASSGVGAADWGDRCLAPPPTEGGRPPPARRRPPAL